MKFEHHKKMAGRQSPKSACTSSRDALQRGLLHGTEHKVEVVALDRLVPHKANARTHGRKQVRKIADSLTRFGFCNPILIDDRDQIIAGHGRVEAAKLLGLTAVPALRLSHLTDVERRAYVLADNRLAELAGWNTEILAIELEGLLDLNFEVELTGFDIGDVDVILDHVDDDRTGDADDQIPEPISRPAVSQVGDRWRLGEHELLCRDAKDYRAYAALDAAIRRWQNYTGKSATLVGTGKTFEQVKKERSRSESHGAIADQTAAPADREVLR
jgi:ParB-like chromosome segregation protein Spo0J